MRKKSVGIIQSITEYLSDGEAKTYTQIAKGIGNYANSSIVKKYCELLSKESYKENSGKILKIENKGGHKYYSINYDSSYNYWKNIILKSEEYKKNLKKYKNRKREFEALIANHKKRIESLLSKIKEKDNK